MMSRASLNVLLASLCAASSSYAGVPPVATYAPTLIGNDKTDTKGYAGLRWDLPGTLAPSLVVGVRRAKTQSDGDSNGGDLSYAATFANGAIVPGKLRLKGFSGDTNHQWELGGGYDFGGKSFFAGPSVNFPHFTAGADFQSAGLNGYGLVHTVGKPDTPAATPTCNPGDTYNTGTGLCETAIAP